MKYFYKSFSFLDKTDSSYKLDNVNIYVSSPEIPYDGTMQGASGAPIFVKDSSSSKWRILGLLQGEFKPDTTSTEA